MPSRGSSAGTINPKQDDLQFFGVFVSDNLSITANAASYSAEPTAGGGGGRKSVPDAITTGPHLTPMGCNP